MNKWLFGLISSTATILGVLTYFSARASLAGSREFNQWLGITVSNKTWLWLICMFVIGSCLGYLAYRVGKRLIIVRRKKLKE